MAMCWIPKKLLLVSLCVCLHTSYAGSSNCYSPDTIDYSLRDQYCDQPIFANFITKTEEFQLLDSICYTYFPLPDDPTTFTVYQSLVYCDGSSKIETFIASQMGIGQSIFANPFNSFRADIIGYAGCDTYVLYGCQVYPAAPQGVLLSLSPSCNSIGLSCLRKVQEVISDRGISAQDLYVLPMKLPNRCVTQQLCLQPPNPFYNNLPSVAIY